MSDLRLGFYMHNTKNNDVVSLYLTRKGNNSRKNISTEQSFITIFGFEVTITWHHESF